MSSETIKMKGFIRVKLVDSETGKVISEEKHNFVNNAMKRVALAQSISLDLCPNVGSPFGMINCFNNQVWNPQTSSGGWLNYNKLPDGPALVLLKFDDSVTLDGNSKMLPILTSTGEIDYSKVTGYSVGRLLSTNEREGVTNITGATQMVNLGNVAQSFLFDTDIATGEFNWIAIMPSFETSHWRSLQAFKCISNYNVRQQGDTNQYGYVRPGVTDGSNVLTGDNEILLFFTHKGVSKWKYNLATGELKPVAVSDFAYNWTNSTIVNNGECGNQIVINGYLFAIVGAILYKINIADGSTAGNISIAYGVASGNNTKGQYGLWYDGTNIVVSSCYNSTNFTNRSYVTVINPSTMSQVSRTFNSRYTGWGGLPSSWNPSQTCFNKCGDVYYVHNVAFDATIVCTNIMNVCGSMVGIMPAQGTALFDANNTVYHWSQSALNTMLLGSETSAGELSAQFPGFWISDETYSNFWSAAKLDETKVKGASVKAYIDYGYEFE